MLSTGSFEQPLRRCDLLDDLEAADVVLHLRGLWDAPNVEVNCL